MKRRTLLGLAKRSAFFRGKTLFDFGVEVYRKSAGVLDLGKSSELPAAQSVADFEALLPWNITLTN